MLKKLVNKEASLESINVGLIPRMCCYKAIPHQELGPSWMQLVPFQFLFSLLKHSKGPSQDSICSIRLQNQELNEPFDFINHIVSKKIRPYTDFLLSEPLTSLF
jgi:hypothetical protein